MTLEETPIQGKISQINLEKGYMFITSEERKFIRFFCHWTSLKQDTLNFLDLKKGMKVEFTPSKDPHRGYRANYVTVLTEEV
jgi:cold shock CspA family protein